MRYRQYTNWGRTVGLALLVGLDVVLGSGSRAAQDASLSTTGSPPVSTTPEVCESRTVNYITHTLPQQCLRTAWTSAAPTEDPRDGITSTGTDAGPTQTITVPAAVSSTDAQVSNQEGASDIHGQEGKDETETEDLATTTFMSFEEWKEMMLRKSGDPNNIKGRKPSDHREAKGEKEAGGINNDLDSLGDDAEISLDFDALSEKVSEITAPAAGGPAVPTPETRKEEQVLYGDGVAQYYRSKDAGKTCKERFSYSSFDAGATILKTSPGAKNAKAILVENKDTYMLLECRAKNKFVIVELSDDILVDTVVLANFEFFSSMIRTFKVSVSDRYPGKWLDLGTFEARNSRDIQPFLVEHPQIYTKYIRIEFLTHYGNEYYCPVSLLRVHGTRLLDGWKDPPEHEEPEQIDAPPPEPEKIEINHENSTQEEARPSSVVKENATETRAIPEPDWTPWDPLIYFRLSSGTCAYRSPTTGEPTPVSAGADGKNHISHADGSTAAETVAHETARPTTPTVVMVTQVPPSPHARVTDSNPSPGSPESPTSQPSKHASGNPSQKASKIRDETVETPQAPPAKAAKQPSNGGTPTTSRNKTTTVSSAASASPTVQESFFKSVTKRLQILESNTTLSLQYIEEQSRFLQEVLLTIEKKQINRVDSFLNTLNKTVLTELRNVRTQYDQIWQSTVIALETQRDQSQREIVALSSRLNVLAEEVVFQKRMAILQSVLLLSCLVLVIFSRGLGGPSSSLESTRDRYRYSNMMSPSLPQQRTNYTYDFNSSPSPPQPPRSRGSEASVATSGRRYYYSDKALPLTPASPDFPDRDGEPEPEAEPESDGGGLSSPLLRADGPDTDRINMPVNVIITLASPATPQFSEGEEDGDRHRGLDEMILMTPPSSRAISEEPILPEDTPKGKEPTAAAPPPVRSSKASSPIREEADEDGEEYHDHDTSSSAYAPEPTSPSAKLQRGRDQGQSIVGRYDGQQDDNDRPNPKGGSGQKHQNHEETTSTTPTISPPPPKVMTTTTTKNTNDGSASVSASASASTPATTTINNPTVTTTTAPTTIATPTRTTHTPTTTTTPTTTPRSNKKKKRRDNHNQNAHSIL
ncbi:Sad1 / UNC-like C-terminal domain containing protein [Naviculisporaceae sp. PSN 640]